VIDPWATHRRFENTHAIVTGGGRGIGRAISLRLASEGADVLLLGRTPEPLRTVAGEIAGVGGMAWFFQTDVSESADVDAAIGTALERWGRLDVLVNNAAIDDPAPFLDIEEANWDRVLAVDLKGPFLLSQRVARSMVRTGSGGAIVNVASVDAFGYDGPYASYSAAKAALLSLTRSMAVELARHEIRTNSVSPAWTATEMMEVTMGPALADRLATRFDRLPLGRAIRPDEVASAVAFLASADAAGITGANLVVDGGLTSTLYVMETISDEKGVNDG
jgi:NAD(P)-dependent dehydrogenase (short-subunit alcohol dehydrogenase family)